VLLTGLLRIYLGAKGAGWYWHNWLLHVKLGCSSSVGLLSIAPTLRFARWRKALRATARCPRRGGAQVPASW
jgi:putative membrane protein